MKNHLEIVSLADRTTNHGIIGKSFTQNGFIEIIKKFSKTNATILITGESGTGKELIAGAIHKFSGRRGEFVVVNCSSIPEHLIESEFFGYAKGAYTGASQNRPGKIRKAINGTLFLDEIGDLPLTQQSKLLRFLQNKEVQTIGSDTTFTANTRVVAATNKDLQKLISEGRFRKDLYYRITQAHVHLPPLRERLEDIEDLTLYFVKKICNDIKIDSDNLLEVLTQKIYKELAQKDWPGNVRQLENEIFKFLVIGEDGNLAERTLLSQKETRNTEISSGENLNLYVNIVALEKKLIKEALARHSGDNRKAAKDLGINYQTLAKKIKNYQI